MARPHEALLEAVAASLNSVGLEATVVGHYMEVGSRYFQCTELRRKTGVRFLGRLYTYRNNLIDPPVQTAVNDVIRDIAQYMARAERRRQENEKLAAKERDKKARADAFEDRCKEFEQAYRNAFDSEKQQGTVLQKAGFEVDTLQATYWLNNGSRVVLTETEYLVTHRFETLHGVGMSLDQAMETVDKMPSVVASESDEVTDDERLNRINNLYPDVEGMSLEELRNSPLF
jgi:hypothetical protein